MDQKQKIAKIKDNLDILISREGNQITWLLEKLTTAQIDGILKDTTKDADDMLEEHMMHQAQGGLS